MNISLRCQCGLLGGVASKIEESRGSRAVCYCDDCQAFAFFLGKQDRILDANGGTDIFPVVPAKLEITWGAENLECMRMSPKGLMRWYAGCCNTAIANTPASSRLAYVGVIHTFMDHAADGTTRDAALGPVRARISGKFGRGKLPEGTHQKASLPVIVTVMRFLFAGFLKRQNFPSPFFNSKTKLPKIKPRVISAAEREELRKKVADFARSAD